MSDSDLRLRPETERDIPFLRSLFATTRVDVTFSQLPEEQKKQFLRTQFDAQRHHYCSHFNNRDFQVIELNGQPVGRLYLARMSSEIRVIDIIISPKHRKQGIGSRLLKAVQSQAKALGLDVTLHAEKMDNMVEYYLPLGFEIVEEKELHFFMKWTASSSIITK